MQTKQRRSILLRMDPDHRNAARDRLFDHAGTATPAGRGRAVPNCDHGTALIQHGAACGFIGGSADGRVAVQFAPLAGAGEQLAEFNNRFRRSKVTFIFRYLERQNALQPAALRKSDIRNNAIGAFRKRRQQPEIWHVYDQQPDHVLALRTNTRQRVLVQFVWAVSRDSHPNGRKGPQKSALPAMGTL